MKPERIGQFEILAELGPWAEGGTVYRAKDAKERPILLRTLRLDAPGAAQKLMQIAVEAKAASALASPNIAGVLGGGKAADVYLLGWEFVEGVKFSTTLAKGEPFTASEVTDLCRQICSALDHATSKNVVHPEFKPGNIIIEWDGTAKILDYGVPRRPIGNQLTDALHYISPEEARGANLSPRSNIFSWGAILYQMVTGKRPFTAENAGDLRRKIIEETPPAPHELKPDVHPGLSKIVMKALAKVPAERYASGAELMHDMENYKRVEVAPPAPPKPVVPPLPPRPVTAKTPAPTAQAKPPAAPVAPPPAPAAAAAPPPPIASPAASAPPVTASAAVEAPAPVPSATPPPPGKPEGPAPKPAAAAPAAGPPKMLIYGMAGAIGLLLLVIIIGSIVMRRSPETPETAATPPNTPAPAVDTMAGNSSQPAAPSTPVPVPASSGSAATTSPRTAKAKQPPSEPPKPAVVQGQVQIDSNPQGAQIQIDGRQEPAWTTPYTASLDPGKHTITLSMAGRMSATRTLDVAANKKTAIAVGLAERAATISVSSDPAEATILLDGQATGKVTPAQLIVAKGAHTVVVRKQGYLDASSTMDLAPGQAAQFTPTLKLSGSTQEIKTAGGIGGLFGGGSKDQGRVTVRSNPKGATVLVNGSAVKKTTPVDFFLNPGNYEITLVLAGHKPLKKVITVEKGGKHVVDETLP
jgi:serine/threonine-protein kinase